MKVLRWSLQIHKWVTLFIGLQILFWVAGGLVMTAIPIERVRSEHHQVKAAPPPLQLDALIGPAEAARRAGVSGLTRTELKSSPRGPLWVLTGPEERITTISAVSGRPLPAMSAPEARRLAKDAYIGKGRPDSVRYFPKAPPETGREGALWRIDFTDAERTSFYVSPETGEIITRRSNVWRFYDFFWRLHIMDWKDGKDFNHPLIIAVTALSLGVVITGFVLLWVRLSQDWRATRRRRTSV